MGRTPECPRSEKGDRNELWDYVRYLESEIERLKEGRFTQEEFQNLCHNFDTSDVCRFREGCRQYQLQLFGREALNAAVVQEVSETLTQFVKEIRTL